MTEPLAYWPVLAFMAVQTVAITWWAATITQRTSSLEEKAKAHETHGSDIAVLKSSIESLATRIGDLVDEIRATYGPRVRK